LTRRRLAGLAAATAALGITPALAARNRKRAEQQRLLAVSYRFVTAWGSNGDERGEFRSPLGIAVERADGSAGYVYVADTQNHRIQKFSNTGAFLLEWGSYGSGQGQFNEPSAIAIEFRPAGNGAVYVADTGNERIQKFSSDGVFITAWGTAGSGRGQFREPLGIAVGTSGEVFVTDAELNNVQVFANAGAFILRYGSEGDGPGEFETPVGIGVSGPPALVSVADRRNHRIQQFNFNGSQVRQWGSQGQRNGQFNDPSGIATDGGRIFVADTDNNRVQRFEFDGTFIAAIGSSGNGNGQFDHPAAVAVDRAGNVFVADTGNNRVQKFALG
jgi:DNA-binding beta-propeller fold protein YncE